MAISKVNFNSLNVTPSASKFLAWDGDADALAAADIGGALTLISTATASSSANLSFTSGIDSTYKEYVFKFINMHPASNSHFSFNMSADGGSNYNVTKTSSFFYGLHFEDAGTAQVDYDGGRDLAQGTGIQHLSATQSANNADDCISGALHLFDPSNTTFVKHFIAHTSGVITNPGNTNNFTAGYGNTTSAIDAIQFSYSSGNIDSGVIKMYGVS
jgi:hypothetical protein